MNVLEFRSARVIRIILPLVIFSFFCTRIVAFAGSASLSASRSLYPVDAGIQITFAEGTGAATAFYIFDDSGSSFNNGTRLFYDSDSPLTLTQALGSLNGFPLGVYTIAAYSSDSFLINDSDSLCGLGHALSECAADGHVYAQMTFTIDNGVVTGGGSSGAPSSGNGDAQPPADNPPTIHISAPNSGQRLSGTVPIAYRAEDSDFSLGGDYVLGPAAVNLYYSTPRKSDWVPIQIGQPASGTVLWDTTKLPDGAGYQVYAVASDKMKAAGKTLVENITIDNTAPRLTARVSSSFSRGETVSITIESSEPLKDAVQVSVAQSGHPAVPITLVADSGSQVFKGSYKPIPGFDGPVAIVAEGVDMAGNHSAVLKDDALFSVGIKPPAAPMLEVPADNQKNGSSTTLAHIAGSYDSNTRKIVITVNGAREYSVQAVAGRHFSLDNIRLDPMISNRGINTIRVVAFDAAGAASQPVVRTVIVNSAPTVTFTAPLGKFLELNGIIVFHWAASDINDDPLKYELALSRDGGETWAVIADNLEKSSFAWNSRGTPDATNYLFRVVASDGSLTGRAVSEKMSIVNNLPAIILDASDEFFTSSASSVFSGIVRSKNDLLAKLELSLDGGGTWRTILPEDGAWDSIFERFHIALKNIRGQSVKILLRGTAASGRTILNAQNLRVVFDDTPPTLAVDSSFSPTAPHRNLELRGVARDNFSGIKSVEYSIDGSPWYEAGLIGGSGATTVPFLISHHGSLPDGPHRVALRSRDRADNISAEYSEHFASDATAPRIGSFTLTLGNEIVFPDEAGFFRIAQTTSTLATLKIAIAGNPQKVILTAGADMPQIGLDGATGLWESGLLFAKKGTFDLAISAEDSLGNKKNVVIAKILVADPGSAPGGDANRDSATESWFSRIRHFFTP